MKIFDVTITRFGFVQVEAESESEAFDIAGNLNANEINWSDDYAPTDVREFDY